MSCAATGGKAWAGWTRLPVRSPMLQRAGPVPMAQAEKAAVLSALTLMMTSGLPGAAAPQCTVASAATPSGDAGSGAAQEAACHCWNPLGARRLLYPCRRHQLPEADICGAVCLSGGRTAPPEQNCKGTAAKTVALTLAWDIEADRLALLGSQPGVRGWLGRLRSGAGSR